MRRSGILSVVLLLTGLQIQAHAAITAGDDFASSVAMPLSGARQEPRWRVLSAEDVRAAQDRIEAFAQIVAAARHPEPSVMLARTTRIVNAFLGHVDDEILYGRPDHWATIDETFSNKAGDCEDFALLKMWVLRALGFAPEDLALVILREHASPEVHAVLAVRLGEEVVVLDNLVDAVLPHTTLARRWRPLVSLTHGRAFVHGIRRDVRDAVPATGTRDEEGSHR